jgi:hypothetical protein
LRALAKWLVARRGVFAHTAGVDKPDCDPFYSVSVCLAMREFPNETRRRNNVTHTQSLAAVTDSLCISLKKIIHLYEHKVKNIKFQKCLLKNQGCIFSLIDLHKYIF